MLGLSVDLARVRHAELLREAEQRRRAKKAVAANASPSPAASAAGDREPSNRPSGVLRWLFDRA